MALVFNRQALRDQKMLKEMGYYSGALDGKWGNRSIKAMARFHANGRKKLQGRRPQLPKTMSRNQHQLAFTQDQSKLDNYLFSLDGYGYTDGDAWSREEYRTRAGRRAHKRNSQHYKRLARDKLLFIHGEYQTTTAAHYILGKYWESLSPYNRSGARYSDGNHYERLEYLWGNPWFDKDSHYSAEDLKDLSPADYFRQTRTWK